jgi:hypothetical protein
MSAYLRRQARPDVVLNDTHETEPLIKTVLYAVAATVAAVLAPAAGAAEIKVIASNAVREPYRELMPIFEKSTGHRVTIDWGGTVDIVKQVDGGETADIIIIPAARIDDFIKQGRLVSRVDLARSGVGVAVRAGAPRPDISSAAALRNTLLEAKSIVLSSGPSSVYLPILFRRWESPMCSGRRSFRSVRACRSERRSRAAKARSALPR